MSAWATFILGVCLVAAAVLHGGVYEAGHDFVVNRFTGEYAFVPTDEDEAMMRTPARALTCREADARVAGLTSRR